MTEAPDLLAGPFDLAAERERVPQSFVMETSYLHFGMTGTRLGAETYILNLAVDPGDHCTCTRLEVHNDGEAPFTIPELDRWSYTFDMTLNGDERGPLWGISQDRFATLTDGSGARLSFEARYAAYTSLIDFHSVNDAFTRPMSFGRGIQDLKHIGDRAVHPASFVEAAMRFGAEVKSGSTFRNGEVTLELTALSLVDSSPCALVTYDAGDSLLKMILPLPGGQEAMVEGVSHFRGDIFIDLRTRCVRRGTLNEHMLAETRVEGAGMKVPQYTVRHIVIRQPAVTREA